MFIIYVFKIIVAMHVSAYWINRKTAVDSWSLLGFNHEQRSLFDIIRGRDCQSDGGGCSKHAKHHWLRLDGLVLSAPDKCRHLPVVGHCGSVGPGRGRRHGSHGTDQCCYGHSATQATGNCVYI